MKIHYSEEIFESGSWYRIGLDLPFRYGFRHMELAFASDEKIKEIASKNLNHSMEDHPTISLCERVCHFFIGLLEWTPIGIIIAIADRILNREYHFEENREDRPGVALEVVRETEVPVPTNQLFADDRENLRTFDPQRFLEVDPEVDMDALRKQLFEEMPELRTIVQEIRKTRPFSFGIDSNLVCALCVLFGIKPVLVVEKFLEKNNTKMKIEALFSKHPSLKWVEGDYGNSYLINESPLEHFDPRRFIEHFDENQSLEKAVLQAFPKTNSSLSRTNSEAERTKADQELSYLLGFGPTWERYAGITRQYKSNDSSRLCFSDEHYLQLGKALDTENKLNTKQSWIAQGKKFSETCTSSPRPHFFDDEGKSYTKELASLLMIHHCGPIAWKTEYIQTAMRYRKQLFALLEIPTPLILV